MSKENERSDPDAPGGGAREPEMEAGEKPGGAGPSGSVAGEPFEIDMESLTEGDVRDLLERAREGAENLDRLRCLRAEHENYRKRMTREATVQRQWVLRDFLLDLLPVVDNLERALDSSGESAAADEASIREGVRMVLDMIQITLKRHGVEAIEAMGESFDPAFHEAAGFVDTAGVPAGTVAVELLKGYVLKGLVIRPSRVLVEKQPETARGEAKAAEEGGEPEGNP